MPDANWCWKSYPTMPLQHALRRNMLKIFFGIFAALTLITNDVRAQTVAGGSQGYPSKAIRIIVPYAPGGPTDILARTVSQRLTEAWGQPVVIENRAGAAGMTGTALVAKAPADGYTMA